MKKGRLFKQGVGKYLTLWVEEFRPGTDEGPIETWVTATNGPQVKGSAFRPVTADFFGAVVEAFVHHFPEVQNRYSVAEMKTWQVTVDDWNVRLSRTINGRHYVVYVLSGTNNGVSCRPAPKTDNDPISKIVKHGFPSFTAAVEAIEAAEAAKDT